MANLLSITKEDNEQFSFVLNGDASTEIINTRNDLLTVGSFAHFKTSNGANLIKEQNILFGNISLFDGVTPIASPTSTRDLFDKLTALGFFDWIDGTGSSGGVDRFDDLLDTFKYFGKDGQFLVVDESQLKLVTVAVAIVTESTQLTDMPTVLSPGMVLKVNDAGTAYVLTEVLNYVSQSIDALVTDKAPSEKTVYDALALKANIADFETPDLQEVFNEGSFGTLSAPNGDTATVNVEATEFGTNIVLDVTKADGTKNARFSSYNGILQLIDGNDVGETVVGFEEQIANTEINYPAKSAGSYIVAMTSDIPASTDDLPQGSTNKYSTLALIMGYVLTGVSFATGTAITAADTILSAFGKLQKQITDLTPFATTRELMFACSDETTDLTTGTLLTFRMPYGLTLTGIKLCVNTAPSVTKVIVDIKKNGTTILSTLASIDTGATTSVGASVPYVISNNNLSDDSIIAISTTSVGSGTLAKGLKVTLIGTKQ